MIIMEFHLAPMQNISCWAFRASFQGVTDSYSEMIGIDQVLKNSNHAAETMDFYPVPDQRQWLQVITNSPNTIAQLPSHLQQWQSEHPESSTLYGVNINAGCPSPEVIRAGEGVGLIKFTARLKHMVQVFLGDLDSHPFHISVKMRLGVNAAEMRHNKFADFLRSLTDIDDPRLSPTILHFKHANQTSAEPERWEFLEVALDAGVPIIINGALSQPSDLHKIQSLLPSRLRGKIWENQIPRNNDRTGGNKRSNCFFRFSKRPN